MGFLPTLMSSLLMIVLGATAGILAGLIAENKYVVWASFAFLMLGFTTVILILVLAP
ncbi:hypothetical protein ACT3TB_16370 [Micrococcaceae sp. AOP34-BR2-30]